MGEKNILNHSVEEKHQEKGGIKRWRIKKQALKRKKKKTKKE